MCKENVPQDILLLIREYNGCPPERNQYLEPRQDNSLFQGVPQDPTEYELRSRNIVALPTIRQAPGNLLHRPLVPRSSFAYGPGFHKIP